MNNIYSTRRDWVKSDTRTITLNDSYEDYNEFKSLSGIGENELYEKTFNQLVMLYGDVYTKQNTLDYLTTHLRYNIENEVEKFEKQNEVWDNQIKQLFGKYEEIEQFRIGDLTENPENYDKYKSARQTKLESQDILDKIKNIQTMKTPFESVISNLYNKLFITHQKSIDEVQDYE